MKNSLINKISSLGIVLFCQLIACTSPQYNISPAVETEVIPAKSEPETVIEFMGVKVRKPAGVPKEVLQLNSGEAVLKFLTKGNNAQARQSSEGANVDEKTFYKILGKVIDRYPKLNIEGYEKSALARIYKDFPALKTEQDVLNNSNVVATYYERLVTNDFQLELAKEKSNSSGARRSSDYTPNR